MAKDPLNHTDEELAEVGVERTAPQAPPPPLPLPRAKFTEAKMKGEPDTDRRLTLTGSRMKLRERIVQTSISIEGVMDSGVSVAPTGVTLTVSMAKLTDDDQVEQDELGNYRIAPVHEVLLTGENMDRLGSAEKIQERLKEIREEAAAKARSHFGGMEMLKTALAGREVVRKVGRKT